MLGELFGLCESFAQVDDDGWISYHFQEVVWPAIMDRIVDVAGGFVCIRGADLLRFVLESTYRYKFDCVECTGSCPLDRISPELIDHLYMMINMRLDTVYIEPCQPDDVSYLESLKEAIVNLLA